MTGRDLMILLYDRGVSQRELADRLGVTESAVSQWVRRKGPIPPERARQVVTFLEMRDIPEASPRVEVLTA